MDGERRSEVGPSVLAGFKAGRVYHGSAHGPVAPSSSGPAVHLRAEGDDLEKRSPGHERDLVAARVEQARRRDLVLLGPRRLDRRRPSRKTSARPVPMVSTTGRE